MNEYARKIRRLLKDAGWEFLRSGKGDHEIWHNPDTNEKVTLDAGVTSRHTANEVLKQAGLRKAF